jgi:hypothetical protein
MLEIRHVFPLGRVAFTRRVFPTHCKLIRKSRTLRKRTRSATTCNSRITKIFPGLAGISIGKWPSGMEKHSGSLCSRGRISQTQARLPSRFVTLRRSYRKLSRDTKIIKNRRQELRQPCAGKLMKVRNACWKSDAFFLPGDRLHVQSLPNPPRVYP